MRTVSLPYPNRVDAGRALANALSEYAGRDDVIVLGLPRGGVPIVYEVATKLNVPMDVMLVRKLGVPGQEELAMGAIASDDTCFINMPVVEQLQISDYSITATIRRERAELRRREQLYRGDRPRPQIRDHCVILVDDGLATGSTMLAAVRALGQLQPTRVVVAVPVAPPETCSALSEKIDQLLCLATPSDFCSVGKWYLDFSQVTDEQVRNLLQRAWQAQDA